MKLNLIGIPRDAFITLLNSKITFKHSYTPLQIFEFIYKKGISHFDQITNISLDERMKLNHHFSLECLENSNVFTSQIDGTCKFLMQFQGPKNVVETVFIPSDSSDSFHSDMHLNLKNENTQSDININQGTVCISSQVGCALACKFCHTGTQKFQKNLSSAEITSQVMHVMHHTKDLPLSLNTKRNVRNIVLMV